MLLRATPTPAPQHALLDCTLRLVLRGFGRCTVLVGRATDQACLCLYSYCAPFIRRSSTYSQVILRLRTQSVCHKLSPGVAVAVVPGNTWRGRHVIVTNLRRWLRRETAAHRKRLHSPGAASITRRRRLKAIWWKAKSLRFRWEISAERVVGERSSMLASTSQTRL